MVVLPFAVTNLVVVPAVSKRLEQLERVEVWNPIRNNLAPPYPEAEKISSPYVKPIRS
jgi:hypothetical protein